jgi:hypothetical protein
MKATIVDHIASFMERKEQRGGQSKNSRADNESTIGCGRIPRYNCPERNRDGRKMPGRRFSANTLSFDEAYRHPMNVPTRHLASVKD